ncbi:acetate--CoA ligase family protein [Paractinoplanes globisporus]|uniref:Acetate--CoA ligase family protein n=1 Tax=Paractinoplanes globisporus TaxID=113565 RepID=A0ABW6WBG0_9ACTN|nr:acetate--CoA ligase family protein [Actinoplanes globisporus]
MRDLSALFDPAAVAIIGASDDPAKWGHAVARQALRAGARRPVHLINKRGGTVLGRPAARKLAEVGEPVDLVVVAVPERFFEDAVDDALAQGARAIVGITAGFAETGADGEARQRAIAERVRSAGAALVGPNCLGLVDNTTEVYLSSDAFAPGSVAFLSQSGNLALELGLRLSAKGLGISRFISYGNQADVTLVDLLTSCAEHEATRAIAVYAEDFADGRAFASAAAATSKPVVLLAAGRGAASARSAASHTGALTSPADVVAAACRDAGIHQAATPRELTVLLEALSGPRRATGRRTAVLTDGGGHGSIAADVAEAVGLTVPELSGPLQSDLRDLLWGPSAVGNPVDLAGMGEQDPASYPAIVESLIGAPEVDAVLMTGFFGGYSAAAAPDAASPSDAASPTGAAPTSGASPSDAASPSGTTSPSGAAFPSGGASVLDGADAGAGLGDATLGRLEVAAAERFAAAVAGESTPVVVQSMYPDSPSCRVLTAAGIPVFGAVEDAARALAAVTGGRRVRAIASLPPPQAAIVDAGYFAARELLARAGVAFPEAREVRDEAGVLAAAGLLAPPYALKAVGLLHKTDAGGVALGLNDPGELVAAFREMRARLGEMAYSVERMVKPSDSVELIAGVKRDPRFGPIVMVGLGGVHAEVLRDVAFALAPIDAGRARELLGELRSSALLHGVRNRPPVNIAAVAETVAALAEVAAAHPEIVEIEVNPLLAGPEGPIALDARVIL